MGFSTTACNLMLDALRAQTQYASLHSGDPGETGANELSGGSPAYARKAITFAAAANKQIVQNGTAPLFDIPPSSSVQYVGFWTAITGGTWLGSKQVTTEAYTGQGTYLVQSTTITQS